VWAGARRSQKFVPGKFIGHPDKSLARRAVTPNRKRLRQSGVIAGRGRASKFFLAHLGFLKGLRVVKIGAG